MVPLYLASSLVLSGELLLISRSFISPPTPGAKGWAAAIHNGHSASHVKDVQKLVQILLLFSPLPLFWALYDQQSSRWTAQALRMNNEIAFGIRIPPESMQTCNAVLILVFIPLFEGYLYPLLERVIGLTPTRKITIGMSGVATSFLIACLIQIWIDRVGDGVVPIWMQIPQYIVMTGGEVFFSITGLEFAVCFDIIHSIPKHLLE